MKSRFPTHTIAVNLQLSSFVGSVGMKRVTYCTIKCQAYLTSVNILFQFKTKCRFTTKLLSIHEYKLQ